MVAHLVALPTASSAGRATRPRCSSTRSSAGPAGVPLTARSAPSPARDRAEIPKSFTRRSYVGDHVPLVLGDRRRDRGRSASWLHRPRLPAGDERPRAAHDLAHGLLRYCCSRSSSARVYMTFGYNLITNRPTTTASRSRVVAIAFVLQPTSSRAGRQRALPDPRVVAGRSGRCSRSAARARLDIPLQYLGRPYILYRAAPVRERTPRAAAGLATVAFTSASTPGRCSAPWDPTSRRTRAVGLRGVVMVACRALADHAIPLRRACRALLRRPARLTVLMIYTRCR